MGALFLLEKCAAGGAPGESLAWKGATFGPPSSSDMQIWDASEYKPIDDSRSMMMYDASQISKILYRPLIIDHNNIKTIINIYIDYYRLL